MILDLTIPQNFSVIRRNYGHWDIVNDKRRLFRIRGGPSDYRVIDERKSTFEHFTFRTIAACMSFVCDELMYELIIVDGQKPQIIESWNISTTNEQLNLTQSATPDSAS